LDGNATGITIDTPAAGTEANAGEMEISLHILDPTTNGDSSAFSLFIDGGLSVIQGQLQVNSNGIALDVDGGLSVVGTNFSDIGSCTMAGTTYTVLDSTTNIVGSVVTGGGSSTVQAFCDGTNWLVGQGGVATGVSLAAVTPSIGGSLLSAGCSNQTPVTVTGALTTMVCAMSGQAGNPANLQPQCSVTATNTVVPQLCTAIALTPAAQVYNIRVF
jgi:hypothetical protein